MAGILKLCRSKGWQRHLTPFFRKQQLQQQRNLSSTREQAFKLLRLHTFTDEELSSSFRRLKEYPTDKTVDISSGIERLAHKHQYEHCVDESEAAKIIALLSDANGKSDTIVKNNSVTFTEYRTKMKALGEKLDPRVYNIGLSFLLAGGSVGMMIPAMPMLVEQLAIPSSQFGLVIGAFGLSKLIGNIPSGYLVEKYGRKPMMIAGLGICGVGICAIGMALLPGFGTPWLVGCRFVSGVGVSAFVAGGFMFMSDISTALNRTRTIAPVMAGFSGGAALGPAVGGILLENIGIANTYLCVGSLFLALAASNHVLISETKPELIRKRNYEKRSLELTHGSATASTKLHQAKQGVIEAAGASVPTTHDFRNNSQSQMKDTEDQAMCSGSSTVSNVESKKSSLFESFGEAFSSWKVLLRDSADLRRVTLFNGAYWFAYSGTQMTLLPLYMVSPVFHLNAYEIGGCFAFMSAVSFLASQPSAILADKFGKGRNMILGSSLLTVAMVCLPFASTLPELVILTIPMSLGATSMNATPAALVGDLTEQPTQEEKEDKEETQNNIRVDDELVRDKEEKEGVSSYTSSNSSSSSYSSSSSSSSSSSGHKKEEWSKSTTSESARAQALSLLRTVGDVGFLFGAASSGIIAQVLTVPMAMQINGAVLAVSALSFAALSTHMLKSASSSNNNNISNREDISRR